MKRDNSGIFKIFSADEAGIANAFYNKVLDYAETQNLIRHRLDFSLSFKNGEVSGRAMRITLYFVDATLPVVFALAGGWILLSKGRTCRTVQEAVDEVSYDIDDYVWNDTEDDEDEIMGNF